MKGRTSAASKLLIATVATVLLLGTYAAHAHGFTNSQSASLVIGQKDFTSKGPATSQSGLYSPTQVVFDSSGNLWVADLFNVRVLEFKPPFSTGMQASLVIGQPDFTTGTQATTQSGFFGWGPHGLGFDSSGNLWVADHFNSRVLEFKPPFSTGMPASLVIGQKDFTTRIPGGSKDELSRPAGVAFDHSGNLWVFDGLNSRILGFTPPFSNGMNASLVIGQHDFGSHAASTTQSGLASADAISGGLAIDPSDSIWVADAHNNRVLEFKPPFSNGMNASLVIGQPDFVTKTPYQCADCGPQNTIGRTGFANPSVAVDPAGNLWVSDLSNNRLLEFQPPFSNGMAASLVIGQQDFTTGDNSTTMNGLSWPEQPAFDASGNLWVPEYENHRILEFSSSSASVTSTTSPSTQSTTSSATSTQSSQTSAAATTTTQGLGQLPYIAAGAVIVVVAVGLIAVFLLRSRRRRGAA